MKKILLSMLLCVLLIGCANKDSDSITGSAVASDQLINCPDCDDGNKCTTDICSSEKGECVYVPVRKCCGNGNCEAGESCFTCDADCGECYTLSQFQRDVNRVYEKKIFFTPNKAIGKKFGEATSPYYDFYDSTYVTVIELKNEEDFITSFKDFEEFIAELGEARFSKFNSEIERIYSPHDYIAVTNYSTEVTGALGGDMIIYSQWARMYKRYRSCAICNNYNQSYETKSLVEPVMEGLVYIRCAPNLIAAFYSNQPQMLEKFWTNLKEEEYDAQVQTWVDREARGAYDEASLMLNYCVSR